MEIIVKNLHQLVFWDVLMLDTQRSLVLGRTHTCSMFFKALWDIFKIVEEKENWPL